MNLRHIANNKVTKHLMLLLLVFVFGGLMNAAWGQTDPETVIDDLSGITSATGKYKFSNSFTATGTPANNIGTDSNPFCGVLDGDFVEITLASNPLFASVENATIKNVIISSASVSTTGNAGAIANKVAGDSRIYNCGLLAGTVSGSNYVGGLVGLLDGTSRVINCYSFANVTSAAHGSGVVGYNNTSGATQNNYSTKAIVMNCMFYGEITAATESPVYGGNIIVNNNTTGINNYNYFLETATFDNAYTNINQYKNSWPAEERFLTRFEYYRSILNSNRRLCTWWVNGATGVAPTDEDVATVGIAKWVLDPSIAPYPILKPWGKYPSVINQNPEQVWDETSQEWKSRDNLPAYQGKKLGTLTVTVKAGSNNTNASDKTLVLPILDMDTLHSDYCYAKVQLPYYNEQFGNPGGTTHAEKYGNNYTDKIVTGWKINSVTGGTQGSFEPDWEQGYNFADRYCTDKDLYSVSNRVFAQGGYYYVPEGVTAITIEAYWGNAVYLQNGGSYLDRVNLASNPFSPAGTLPTNFNGQPVYDNIKTAISKLQNGIATYNVYDQAVVLVSNYQYQNLADQTTMGLGNNTNLSANLRPFTWTCVDLDFDNEPDYCLELQYGRETTRVNIHPVRFDFIPIPDLGLAIKKNSNPYGCGIFITRGHFEITETAFMHANQFEYDGHNGYRKETAPLILNGGQYEQIVTTVDTYGSISNHTNYIIIGGHVWMKKFTPGTHINNQKPSRLCAVSVLGAEFQEFYLTGMFRSDISGNDGSPHCYTNGGRFGLMAGAGMEQVNGDVTFKIDHSIVDEFYGGGINSDKPVMGSIHVTIDNSLVGYYCGGPKTGNMQTGTEVVTTATKSTFGKFFGGGNGGNNFTRTRLWDNTDATLSNQPKYGITSTHWNNNGHFGEFQPFTFVNAGVGYHAQFEFELMNNSGGNNDYVVARTYRWDAQFSMTEVQTVTSTLTDCHVKQEFYGGGNLSPVHGDVVSTLDNTRVDGSAFGAGFSATIPSFSVHDKTTVVYPSRDIAGICHPGSLEYQKDGDVDRLYTWIDNAGLQRLGVSGYDTSNPAFQYDGKWYCYTGVELSNLGTVGGNTTLVIKGNSEIQGSVFGGGDESAVTGNTEVDILGKTKVFGNIYGGGNMGHVDGDTKVIINGQNTEQGTGQGTGSGDNPTNG